ncbi:nitrate regulatory gene2 protein isoform X2 [Neltuma alba]|uniref:nitrate regulatory gene2 protein isoform X2 n=1 Tax=Neltuma alba TaxID=207710 RepID=UPI0010A3BEA7|nr:nitrate regulatory gene2 protein-like isoform X2 [Prosopis alba]XP_028778779.1 nitrate regulatory gene2 protein-like isoform X2 [Prosopis alba]
MGCASSKLDDLPAVSLCRQRCSFLDEAIHQRYALSAAHMAYISSLQSIGHSLHRFIHVDFPTSSSPPSSPELNLPPSKKVDSVVTAAGKQVDTSSPSPPHLSHSNSGSHLHFQSDSDEDEDDHELGSLHHSGHSSPLHAHPDHPPINYINHSDRPGLASFPGQGYMHMNFMKNKPTPSVVFEQKPISPETVYMGESSSSSYPYPHPSMHPNFYPHDGYPTYAGGGNGYFASPPPYGSSLSQPAASTSKPPPPPSPPRPSTWDFLNFFDNDDRYYNQYTPSRDSKEVREEEGIPDLEDEDYQHEVVKEVHGDQKFVDGGAGNHSKPSENDEVDRTEASVYQNRPSVSMENDGVEYEVHVVDKKVVDGDERSKERGGGAAFRGRSGTRDAFEVAREIEVQFRRASESGTEIAKMLEAGKLPYNKKYGAYQASSKMLHAVAPSLSMVASQPSTSKSAESTSAIDKAGPSNLDFDGDIMMRSRNLSSTLQKLYLWEKKLYDEVKAEEKMRVMHDKKCRKLKRMDERGADFHKVDSTQTLVRSLSAKIRMAIQVVDRISMTINKIRDEELWPQLNELIHGLTRMWKSMLECHRNQCEAIREARILGSIRSRKKNGDGHLLATKELEQELINWTFQFSSWVSAQKGYVRALNNWLLRCLLYEPEETPDGIVPFSPSRIGAPPIFVICNQWSQALERISEKEVVDSMRVLTMSVLQIWEQDRLEMHQQLMVNKDLERKVKHLDKDDQRIQKQIQALERQMVLASGDGKGLSVSENIIYQSDKSSSLQASLQRIFEAMERFTENSVRAYEELIQRSVEESAAGEHGTVS